MSDMDEGDTPYAEKSCKSCGAVATPLAVWASEAIGACFGCAVPWPDCLEERSPYDGKNRVERRVLTDASRGRIRVSYEAHIGWRVGTSVSVYSPTNKRLTESEAVVIARQCEAAGSEPGAMLDYEIRQRQIPLRRLARKHLYEATALVQNHLDARTGIPEDIAVVVDELRLRSASWKEGKPERALEDVTLHLFVDLVLARYKETECPPSSK